MAKRIYFAGDTRPCRECGAQITITEAMARWSKYVCMPCQSARSAQWSRENPEKKRAGNNTYFETDKGKQAIARANRRYKAKYPEKVKARSLVQTELRAGRMQRMPCVECGATDQVHAHHQDYSKPLDVEWLCVVCHDSRHRGAGGLNVRRKDTCSPHSTRRP